MPGPDASPSLVPTSPLEELIGPIGGQMTNRTFAFAIRAPESDSGQFTLWFKPAGRADYNVGVTLSFPADGRRTQVTEAGCRMHDP